MKKLERLMEEEAEWRRSKLQHKQEEEARVKEKKAATFAEIYEAVWPHRSVPKLSSGSIDWTVPATAPGVMEAAWPERSWVYDREREGRGWQNSSTSVTISQSVPKGATTASHVVISLRLGDVSGDEPWNKGGYYDSVNTRLSRLNKLRRVGISLSSVLAQTPELAREAQALIGAQMSEEKKLLVETMKAEVISLVNQIEEMEKREALLPSPLQALANTRKG